MSPKRPGGTLANRATNATVRSDLLEAAQGYGINLSATLEAALSAESRRVRQQTWLDHNRDAIAAYNDHVEKHGVFSDGLRKF